MWIKSLSINNFRNIESISFSLSRRANVIIGPNAIGKTTLLEAIRLAKAALCPRAPNETQNAFHHLNAISPHNPTQFNFDAIVREPNRPLTIQAIIELTPDELVKIDTLRPNMATSLVRANLAAAPGAVTPLALVQFLSSSAGQEALAKATEYVKEQTLLVQSRKNLTLKLIIDPISKTVHGENQIDQLVFSMLEATLPPNRAFFSYFPADRALPSGDVNIQMGGPDIIAQLDSHNSAPQGKYIRLKSTILSNFLLSEETRIRQNNDFEKIFSSVLKDRALLGISVNDIGLISIKMQELASRRIFDIDGMSSGEKGLILTFLLISHSIAPGGIIMIDEPELHLNPAVCKTILQFMIDEYLTPNDIQAIICSHSPEILGSAFDSPDCALLHLQSPTMISEILPEDRREVFDALRRLGTSASDALFSAGSIFVEGEDDIEILNAGFDELISKYNISQLGGRGNVEREIRTLQAAEKVGEVNTLKCFIFDHDNIPSGLQGTKFVKVLQWDRRCLENFLLDDVSIYNILDDPDHSEQHFSGRGEVAAILKEFALEQLTELVAKEVYEGIKYESPGLRSKEIRGKANFSEIAAVLYRRLDLLKGQIGDIDTVTWCEYFAAECEKVKAERIAEWESSWRERCDGKQIFQRLHQEYRVKMKPVRLKKLIMQDMKYEKREGWLVIDQKLKAALHIG